MPWLIVRLPWGSMSTASTRWPDSLKATARLSAVVVLATPPFWLAKAITLAGPLRRGLGACFFSSFLPLGDLPLGCLSSPFIGAGSPFIGAGFSGESSRLGPTSCSGVRRALSAASSAVL